MVVLPFVHSYVGVKVSPSGSVIATEQETVVSVSTALGEMDKELKVGAEFSTITLACEVACSPEVSVAVTVHDTTSVGSTVVGESVKDGLVPSEFVELELDQR